MNHDDFDPNIDQGDDVGSPEGVQRAKRKRKKRSDDERDYWFAQLSTPVGRAALWRKLTDAGTFNPTFAASPTGVPDANAAFFYLGRSSFGLNWYHELLAVDLKGVRLMHIENDPRFKDVEK